MQNLPTLEPWPGYKEDLISMRVDWFTGKVATGEAGRLRAMIGGTWLPTLPRWGYRYAYQHTETGAITMAYQPHTEATDLLLCSGQVLGELSHYTGEEHTFALVASLPSLVEGATRVDLAIDLHDGGESANRVAQAARKGLIKTQARKITVMESWGNKGGITTYIGARTSPKMVRVYLKTNLDDTGETVTRFEIEIKSDLANWVWATYLAQPPYPTLADVSAIIRTHVQWFGHFEADMIFSRDADLILPPRRDRQLTTKDWLARQVVPTLKADYKTSKDGCSVLQWLITQVTGIEIAKLPPQ